MLTKLIEYLSSLAAPLIILLFALVMLKKRELYSSFIKGAQDGLKTALGVFPVMTMLLVALSLFKTSTASECLTSLLSPICVRLGIPEGIIPLAVMRPFSGSASTAAYSEVLTMYGADSFESFAASVLMGSGDTLVYVISVYYSAVKMKKQGRVFPISAFVAVIAVFLSCAIARIFFGN